MKKSFPHYIQLDMMDCGPTCLRMISKYYGRSYSLQNLREKLFVTRRGVSMLGVSDAAESIGLHTNDVKINFNQLVSEVSLPCILHWNQNHFVVCYKIERKNNNYKIRISDPARGKYAMNGDEFRHCWIASKHKDKEIGVALLLQPTPEFYDHEDDHKKQEKNLIYFFRYLFPYKSQLA